MNHHVLRELAARAALLLALVAFASVAQESEERDNLQPAVDSSDSPEPAVDTSASIDEPAAGSDTDRSPANLAQDVTREQGRGQVMDRLDLGTTEITGNSELPKVLYIVPWKKAAMGDLSGKPMESLLDEVLTPLDREEFVRHVNYFDELNGTTEEE